MTRLTGQTHLPRGAIWRAEWTRLVRQPAARWTLAALAVLLFGAAAWSGASAAALRGELAAQGQALRAKRAAAVAAAPSIAPDAPAAAGKAAESAFAIGRGELAATRLPPLGGLVLGTQRYAVLSTSVRVSVEVRHTDGRALGTLSNPLLAETGLPGFPTVVVLLLPLAALALTAGAVQEDRERGTWRLVCAQAGRSVRRVFAVSLALRLAALVGVAVAASALAFALDPGASGGALARWCAVVTLFAAFWVLVGGALSVLPLSAAAAAAASLGVWLALTVAVPALLAWGAARAEPMPSRLAAIVRVRAIQLETEARDAALLRAWYDAHPAHRPAPGVAPTTPTWPVTFQPRFLAQDSVVRPLMRRFDAVRAAHFETMERWAWLSPPLALVQAADRLAGVDAPRYAAYVDEVDRFEDRWRAAVVPGVMSYRGLTAADVAALPAFEARESRRLRGEGRVGVALARLGGACLPLLLVLYARRRRLDLAD